MKMIKQTFQFLILGADMQPTILNIVKERYYICTISGFQVVQCFSSETLENSCIAEKVVLGNVSELKGLSVMLSQFW